MNPFQFVVPFFPGRTDLRIEGRSLHHPIASRDQYHNEVGASGDGLEHFRDDFIQSSASLIQFRVSEHRKSNRKSKLRWLRPYLRREQFLIEDFVEGPDSNQIALVYL